MTDLFAEIGPFRLGEGEIEGAHQLRVHGFTLE